MSDPTPAEIEAGARVLDQWEHYVAADSAHVAELVLRAVLPDHDTRLREQIARAIEAIDHLPSSGCECDARDAQAMAARIARAHTTGEDPT